MQTDRSEYLPSQEEERHKPVFRLAPVQEDLTQIILQVRREALRDKELSTGAKLLFVWLLDLSLLWTVSRARGVVIISMTKLAEHLSCCRKSIANWKRELVTKRLIWVHKHFNPNFWALNEYHITVIDPPGAPSQRFTQDGIWGNGTRRPEAPEGARSKIYTADSGDSDPQFSEQKEENSLVAGTSVPAPGVNFTPERGKILPAPGVKKCTPHGQPGSRPTGNGVPAAREKKGIGRGNGVAHIREPQAGSRELDREGKASSPPQIDRSWEKKLKGLYPRELRELKADLVRQQQKLPAGDPAVPDLSCRIETIDRHLYGGAMPSSSPKPQARPARAARVDKPLSEPELLESARTAKAFGKAHLLTAAQREALARAGEL